jgi:hypothetical protein
MRRKCVGLAPVTLLSAFLIGPACAQEPASWRGPSKHKAHFVPVEEGVQLEALDWEDPDGR